MPDQVVTTSFRGKDALVKLFGRQGRAADKFGNKASKAFTKASRAGKGFQSITKGILTAGLVQRGIGMVSQGISSIVRQFIEFDDAVTGATVRFKDIGPAAANFNEQLQLIKASARDAGATTEFTAAQAAKGLDFLARAGFESAAAMGSLASMIDLATATGEDFAQVADMSSDLLGSFGLASDVSAEKIKNLNRLNDVLVKTANSANVTVESMFETMKVGAPIAVKFGAELEDVAAITAFLGNAGIKGSLGATAIKNIFTRLAAPTKEVTEALGKLSLSQQDLINKNGKFKDISNTMALIGDRIKDLPQAQQLGVLSGIFGKRALAGGANIIDSISKIKDFVTVLQDSSGTAKATADILRKTLGNRLKALGSAATEAGFKFLEAFSKDGKDAITRLTTAVRDFDMTPIIEGAKTTFKVLKAVFDIVGPFIPAILALAASLKVASIAMGILNFVMTANPIGLIIVGIGLLIAAVILLVKNWDTVSAALLKAWNWFNKILDNPLIATAALIFAPFITIPAMIIKHWSPIKDFFIKTGNVIMTKFIEPIMLGFANVAKMVLGIGGALGKFTGIDVSKLESLRTELSAIQADLVRKKEIRLAAEEGVGRNVPRPRLKAPNKSAVSSRQKIDLSGAIKIFGAPDGSEARLQSSHGSIRTEMLGANP